MVETDHFAVYYYAPLGDIAHRVAVVAERSHRVLAPALGHEPAGRTHIVVVDDTDGSNGFASVLPRNAITLFATAPSGLSTLNDHDDWLYGLTAHEYTHILHLDSIGGLPALYNKIFGKIWAPNQVQPRWIIEGISTYQESKRSSSGRTRSALFDMILRVPTLAGEELRLDAVTAGPRAFPHGTAAYLYGSHFLKYVFDRFGDDTVRKLSWEYGSNPIPYAVNRSIERVTKRTFNQLYADWRQHLRNKYRMTLRGIERRGRREGRRLTYIGEANASPIYTRDGRHLVWRQSTGSERARFRRMPVGANAGKAEDYVIIDRTGTFDVLSDGSLLVEQTDNFRTNYAYQELFVWRRKTRRMEQLTRGVRSRDPASSPDERRVAFVTNARSRSRLAMIAMRPDAKVEILYTGPGRFDQVSAPAWAPDGKTIAFSAWRAGGFRDILMIDLATRKVTELMRDRAIDADPVFGPKGRYLYYSSDRTGIYNVYAYDLRTKKTHQVTNVVGCALVPTVSPDGKRLAYQGFARNGYEIYEIALDPARWLEPELYVNTRPEPVSISDTEVRVSKPRAYRPLATLSPQTYQVQLVNNSFGRAVNVVTQGADIVGFHSYSLATTLGLERGDLSIGGSYLYRRLWPSLRVTASRSIARRGGVVIDGVNTLFTEEFLGLTLSAAVPVLQLPDGAASMSIAYDVDWLRNVEDQVGPPDPNALVPRLPETDVRVSGLALRFNYGDTRGYIYTLGPQEGQALSGSIRVDHPALGSDFRALTLSYAWLGFYRLPFGQTPVLSFRFAGGLRTTDRRRSGVFSLGGLPEQDLVDSVLKSVRAGSTGYLRGFPSRIATGRQFHLANLEYRQELWNIERGVSTLPFYLRRLHLAGLLDVGNAFNGEIDPRDFKFSVGGALRLDMLFGYFVPGSLDIGYSRGLTEGGVGQYWMLLTGTL